MVEGVAEDISFKQLLTGEILVQLESRTGPFEYGKDAPWGPSVQYRTDLGQELANVLFFVKRNVEWTEDFKTRGQIEHWGLPIFKDNKWRGDCDDFMNASRLILTEMGWDEKVLRRMVCFAPPEIGDEPTSENPFNHAVLGVTVVVDDKIRILVLDNRWEEVYAMSFLAQKCEYTNFSILSVFDSQWHGIGFA